MARKKKNPEVKATGAKREKGERWDAYKHRMKVRTAKLKETIRGKIVVDQPIESRSEHREAVYGKGSDRHRAFVIGHDDLGNPQVATDRSFTKPSVPRLRARNRRRNKAAKLARRRNR